MAKNNKITNIFKGIGLIALVLCAVFFGKILGNVVVSALFNTDEYSKYTEAKLMDNEAAILSEFNSGAITFEKLKSGDAAKAFVISNNILKTCGNYRVESLGVVANPVGDQNVKATFEKNGDVCVSTEISDGIKRVANKVVYDKNSNSVKVYKGSIAADGVTGIFGGNFESYTSDGYKTKNGKSADTSISHLITSKTIESATMVKSGDLVKFNLKLHCVKSAISYSLQIASNTGLSRPKFEYINFSFTIDKNFKMVEYSVDECYLIEYGITVKCNSTINAKITY